MMEDFVPFGGPVYVALLALLAFARGMDFLSTWIATPNLILEANPIARKLGWRAGIGLNLILCAAFAFWPLPAMVIITTSMLVAARNFQSAWLMRSLGEERYRHWISDQLAQTHLGLYFFCVSAQCLLVAILGATLMYFSFGQMVPFAVGLGMITYALAVAVYTALSAHRIRRSLG